jgi:spore maturation protein CgeB
MLRKVIMFMPPYSQYGVLHVFTQELAAALERQGTEVKMIEGRVNQPQELLNEIFHQPPDCTISFNGLLPDQEGRFFCDLVQIPHIACLVHSPNHFFPLIKSPYTIITSVDRTFCNFFSQSKSSQVLFMPHAISKDLYAEPEKPRKYDVVMLSSFIDPELARATWQERCPPRIAQLIEIAAEITLTETDTSFIEAFTRALNEEMQREGPLDLKAINYELIFDLLEAYVKGVDRLELVRAVHNEHRVDLFGAGEGWKKFFPKSANLVIHDPIPYGAALEVMKESKIVLNSCINIKNGAHDRIFSALACGALPCTSENIYMREQFQEGEELIFYRSRQWDQVNETIAHYLENEPLRCELVNNGYQKVRRQHTWDNRAQMLQDFIPAMLEYLTL